jgi:hypothetical protein
MRRGLCFVLWHGTLDLSCEAREPERWRRNNVAATCTPRGVSPLGCWNREGQCGSLGVHFEFLMLGLPVMKVKCCEMAVGG